MDVLMVLVFHHTERHPQDSAWAKFLSIIHNMSCCELTVGTSNVILIQMIIDGIIDLHLRRQSGVSGNIRGTKTSPKCSEHQPDQLCHVGMGCRQEEAATELREEMMRLMQAPWHAISNDQGQQSTAEVTKLPLGTVRT
jgi:hypothetical protein